jgi:RNA polymerase sigma factor (sigma-70 family)
MDSLDFMDAPVIDEQIADVFRHQTSRVLARLTRLLGSRRFEEAEDILQDTLIKALKHWGYHGMPDNPGGWLMTAAQRQALDMLRRERAHPVVDLLAAAEMETRDDDVALLDHDVRDNLVWMLFMCCHPALSRASQIALTLKAVCGLGVPAIARMCLTPESTIAQRLVRAKRVLREEIPTLGTLEADDVRQRLDIVLEVVYLLFTEGFSAHEGNQVIRQELCAEALYVGTVIAQHPLGNVPQTHALLGLMLLQAARLEQRVGLNGTLIVLADQDRSRWDRRLIARGVQELALAAQGTTLTTYHLQAEIAACHAVAFSWATTDWRRILCAYDDLLQLTASPVVALNRAVVVAELDGPEAALVEVERLRLHPGMTTYYLWHATAAELLRRVGDLEEARVAYLRASELAPTLCERQFLQRRVQST